MTKTPRFSSFREFWPFYVGEHQHPVCRLIHYAGGIGSLGLVVYAFAVGPWWLFILAPAVGYGLAWPAHFWVEGNRPATWGYVGYSLLAEFKMLALGLSGRMGREVQKYCGGHPRYAPSSRSTAESGRGAAR